MGIGNIFLLIMFIIALILCIVFVYSLCFVAGKADELEEQLLQQRIKNKNTEEKDVNEE